MDTSLWLHRKRICQNHRGVATDGCSRSPQRFCFITQTGGEVVVVSHEAHVGTVARFSHDSPTYHSRSSTDQIASNVLCATVRDAFLKMSKKIARVPACDLCAFSLHMRHRSRLTTCCVLILRPSRGSRHVVASADEVLRAGQDPEMGNAKIGPLTHMSTQLCPNQATPTRPRHRHAHQSRPHVPAYDAS